jgi:hypothetical protein
MQDLVEPKEIARNNYIVGLRHLWQDALNCSGADAISKEKAIF